MIFNIYYINFPKVYEIKMMLSNIIKLTQQREEEDSTTSANEYRMSLGIGFLNLFNTGLDVKGDANKSNNRSDSQKVLETFEIKTTKSIILSEVLEKSKVITNFGNIREGELIKIDDVALSLDNEVELRSVKFFSSGVFKGMNIPETKGMDINNIFNSMFKDYAYKLQGVVRNPESKFLIKIPLTFESEFESSYSVDDLFIGKVSVIGLYKGKIKPTSLMNTFEFFQELGSTSDTTLRSEASIDESIQDSNYSISEGDNDMQSELNDSELFHYVDLLAIVQNVHNPIPLDI